MSASPQQPERVPMTMGERGIVLSSFEDAYRFGKAVIASGLAPKGDTPESILIKVQMGCEIGLSPMQAVQNIAVINGRPSIYGDAALALVKASGTLEHFNEYFDGDGEGLKAICVSKRKGEPNPVTTAFSVADAKRAKLWGKQGPWTEYPKRMLQFRARGFNLRDNFPDVLRGVILTEEAEDIPGPQVVEAVALKPGRTSTRRHIAAELPPQAKPAPPVREGEPETDLPPEDAQDDPGPLPEEDAPGHPEPLDLAAFSFEEMAEKALTVQGGINSDDNTASKRRKITEKLNGLTALCAVDIGLTTWASLKEKPAGLTEHAKQRIAAMLITQAEVPA